MTTETITVPEIHCGHCKASIEGAVGALAGVARVAVAIEDRTVEVAYDPATVDRDVIIGAIEDQGYEVPARS